MRRVLILLAVLAVAAVVGIYLAGGDSRRRATPAARPVAVDPAPPAPEAPSDPKPGKVARVAVRDEDKNPVAGATVGVYRGHKFTGDTVTTGADGRCALPMPEVEPTGDIGDVWLGIAVRHPDYVLAREWVTAQSEEYVIVLERGARLVVLVLDPARKPVAAAKVLATFERRYGASGFWQWTDRTALAESVTDAEGRAAIGAVPAVTVRIWVDREPFALHGSRVEVTGELPVEHVVVLDGGAVLLGRVVGPGGEGVPGATVKFQEIARPVATTGPSGEFRLEGVPAYTLTLVADAKGFGPGFFGGALGWGEPVPLAVRSGTTMEGLEIVLSKPTFLTGRIVDDDGKPVADVGVGAWIRQSFSVGEPAKSDAEGRFRAGPFSVREAGTCNAWFNAPWHTIERVSKPVEPGKDVDLGEIKATRCAAIRGLLVDEAGNAVEGGISVDFTEPEGDRIVVRAMPANILSKPDGTFEVSRLEPGEVALTARTAQPPLLRSQPAKFQLTAGQTVDGVRLVLLPTKAIGGRVITPDGKPRPGVTLGVRPAGGDISEISATTDAEGKFAFPDLTDGEYDVGLMKWLWRSDARSFLDQPAPATCSPGRNDLEFVLPIKGGIVTGKVVAKRDGRPLKEFTATFIRYKLFIPSDSDWESFEDENGEFRYETDEPGAWQVDISTDGLASHRTDRFSLAAGEVKDLGTIRLGPGGTIAGRVLDAQQRPVPYARINILNEKLQTNDDEPYTDLEGRFEVKGVSPGPFTVFAVSPRHPLGMVRNVEVREGERTDVHISFVEPAPLTIDVRDSSGQPVEGAMLEFTFPAVAPLTSKMFRGKIPPGYGSHKSDAGGTILQPCLPPGEVTITIEAHGFESVTRKLDLKPGEPNRVEIRLRRKSP